MKRSQRIASFLFLLAACTAWLHLFRLIYVTQIHWDEFYFLSKIHAHQQDRWSHAVQSIYVHIVSWVTWAGANEVDQVQYGRLFSGMICVGLMVGSIFVSVRHLTGSVFASLVSVFLMLSHPFLAFQLFRFRVDPMLGAGFLLCASLLIWGRERRYIIILTALILGWMGALSVKSILLAPSLAFLLLLPKNKESIHKRIVRVVLFAFTSALSASFLLTVHSWTLSDAGLENSQQLVKSAGSYMFGSFFPRDFECLETMRNDFFFWLPVFASWLAVLVGTVRGRKETRKKAWICFFLCLPMLTLFFYRNAFAYFYVCIVPSSYIAVGWMVSQIEERLSQRWQNRFTDWLIPLILSPLFILFVIQSNRDSVDSVSHQREFLDMVKIVFPESVPYLDRCSMVASYPKIGPFLTVWNIKALREGAQPTLTEQIRTQKPLYLVNNVTGLNLGKKHRYKGNIHYLPKSDYLFLKANYLRHSGPLWVIGKKIRVNNTNKTFEIVIPGEYTIETKHPVLIDAQPVSPNDSISFTAGWHTIRYAATNATSTVKVRWGTQLPKPELSEPKRPLFMNRFHPVRPKQTPKSKKTASP